MNFAASTKRARQMSDCPHTETLTTVTAGLERIVCESCGHLSFNFPETLSGPIQRRWFARPADYVEPPKPDEPADEWLLEYTPVVLTPQVDELAATAVRAFAAKERFHIRSRYELHPEASAVA